MIDIAFITVMSLSGCGCWLLWKVARLTNQRDELAGELLRQGWANKALLVELNLMKEKYEDSETEAEDSKEDS